MKITQNEREINIYNTDPKAQFIFNTIPTALGYFKQGFYFTTGVVFFIGITFYFIKIIEFILKLVK